MLCGLLNMSPAHAADPKCQTSGPAAWNADWVHAIAADEFFKTVVTPLAGPLQECVIKTGNEAFEQKYFGTAAFHFARIDYSISTDAPETSVEIIHFKQALGDPQAFLDRYKQDIARKGSKIDWAHAQEGTESGLRTFEYWDPAAGANTHTTLCYDSHDKLVEVRMSMAL
jgi:hypothetical protein